jgi:ribosome recycling factor
MNDWKPRMEKAVGHLAERLAGIRPGLLSVGFIETFRVPLHGNSLPVGKIASVTRHGDRVVITPFDPSGVPAIVKALAAARLNSYALNPKTVGVSVPEASGEQRAEMARHVKRLGEESKVAVRSIRQEARKQIAVRGRGSERAVQEATDVVVAEIDRLVAAKMTELTA